MIWLDSDGEPFMDNITNVSWDGGSSTLTITLEKNYLGAGGTGIAAIDQSMPNIPSGKWVKHMVLRTQDDLVYVILVQLNFKINRL